MVAQVLKKCGIEYVVAPYEADAQLAFLSMRDLVAAVITEDSDLLGTCESISMCTCMCVCMRVCLCAHRLMFIYSRALYNGLLHAWSGCPPYAMRRRTDSVLPSRLCCRQSLPLFMIRVCSDFLISCFTLPVGIVFGCKRVIFKMDSEGRGQEVLLSSLGSVQSVR